MRFSKKMSGFLLLIAILTGLYAGCSQTKQPSTANETKKQVTVYIDGNVARPGQYAMQAGSTVNDAIQRAGGLLPDADTSKFHPNEQIETNLYLRIPGKASADTGSSTKPPVIYSTPHPSHPSDPNPTDNGMTTLEQKMLNLVNQERISRGIPPLSPDIELVKAARLKSQDLIDNHYFDHQSPRYGSPADLLLSQGIRFNYAGENLAKVGTLERGHTGLMNSPGHRENILRPEFGKIGIGIIEQGRLGLMITQEFTD